MIGVEALGLAEEEWTKILWFRGFGTDDGVKGLFCDPNPGRGVDGVFIGGGDGDFGGEGGGYGGVLDFLGGGSEREEWEFTGLGVVDPETSEGLVVLAVDRSDSFDKWPEVSGVAGVLTGAGGVGRSFTGPPLSFAKTLCKVEM